MNRQRVRGWWRKKAERRMRSEAHLFRAFSCLSTTRWAPGWEDQPRLLPALHIAEGLTLGQPGQNQFNTRGKIIQHCLKKYLNTCIIQTEEERHYFCCQTWTSSTTTRGGAGWTWTWSNSPGKTPSSGIPSSKTVLVSCYFSFPWVKQQWVSSYHKREGKRKIWMEWTVKFRKPSDSNFHGSYF